MASSGLWCRSLVQGRIRVPVVLPTTRTARQILRTTQRVSEMQIAMIVEVIGTLAGIAVGTDPTAIVASVTTVEIVVNEAAIGMTDAIKVIAK
jgi:hypothetical protein